MLYQEYKYMLVSDTFLISLFFLYFVYFKYHTFFLEFVLNNCLGVNRPGKMS